jgi:rhodanese-related sulfurtransferase
MDLGYAGDLTPKEAWTLLKKSPEAVLIDVRTQPEWAFVGIPNLSSIDKKV